jgi:hypothetical protein
LVAVAIGKIDAVLFVLGALFGMFLYAEIYPLFEDFAQSGFLGSVTLSDWLGLKPGVIAFLVILMALGMFWGAEILEKKFSKQDLPVYDVKKSATDNVTKTV